MNFLSTLLAFIGLALLMVNVASGCLIFNGRIQSWSNPRGNQIQPYTFTATLHDNGVEVCSFASNYSPPEISKMEIWMSCPEGHYGLFERNGDKTEMMYYYGSAFYYFGIGEHHFQYSESQH